jgi:hypothetical protein
MEQHDPSAARFAVKKPIDSGAEITEQELLRRKDFLEFRDDDISNLIGVNELARRYADSVIEDFYRHLLSFEETRSFFRDHEVLKPGQERATRLFPATDTGKLRPRLRAEPATDRRDP